MVNSEPDVGGGDGNFIHPKIPMIDVVFCSWKFANKTTGTLMEARIFLLVIARFRKDRSRRQMLS